MARILDDNEETGGHKRKSTSSARRLASGYAADEIRNRTAGEALELYFKLAAAEAGVEQYRDVERELTEWIDASKKAVTAGFKEPADLADLAMQLAEARAESAKLKGATSELNAGLKSVLGLPSNAEIRLWPDAPELRESAIDPEEAVRVGLYFRPDLLLLRCLVQSEDRAAPSVGRQIMGGVNPQTSHGAELPSLGPVTGVIAKCLGFPVPTAAQNAKTRRHLAELLSERERQAEGEIRAAVDRATALAAQAKIHAESVEEMKKRADELETARAAGRDVTTALAKARGAWRKAQGNLLKTVADYQIAMARLQQAQGLLVRNAVDPATPPTR